MCLQIKHSPKHQPSKMSGKFKQTNKQKFKVRQPQRAAKSKRPNAPADGSKNNGIHTTKQEEYPSRHPTTDTANKQTNKNLRCGNRKGLLGRNDQTHHRMGPKTMESIPPSKRNTQADIQLRTRQTNHQQETDGCIQIKHNPEHQPSRMSSKSTAYVPPKMSSIPTKANTQTCSYLDFNQFLIRRSTRNICLRLRIKHIQILTCREQDIR